MIRLAMQFLGDLILEVGDQVLERDHEIVRGPPVRALQRLPWARALAPTTTLKGSPRRSQSLNFTPGRSSRSSSSTSIPAASRSA